MPITFIYAASRGDIVSMTCGLARSLAPHWIIVNDEALGAADTEIMRGGMDPAGLTAITSQILLQYIRHTCPNGLERCCFRRRTMLLISPGPLSI